MTTASDRDEGRQIRRVRAAVSTYEVLLLGALIWFLGKFVRYAFPPLFDTFQVTYHVSNAQVGFAFSAFMALYALMQFPSGALADRFGSTKVIAVGAGVAGVAAAVLIIGPPFLILALIMAVIGAGTGVHKTVSIRLLSNTYPGRVGRSLGVFDTIGASGGFVAPIVIAGILSTAIFDWRLLFGIVGGSFLASAVLFNRRMENSSARSSDATSERMFPLTEYRRTFGRPRVIVFVGVTVLMAFAYNGTVAFLPLFLIAEAGVSPAVASGLYSILFAATVTQLFTGEAADRFGPLRTVSVCLVGTTLGLAVLVFTIANAGGSVTSTALLVIIAIVVLLIGVGAHGYRPARDVYVVSIVPAATTGGALGIVRTTLMGAAAVAPAVVGIVADRHSFLIAFGLLSVAAAGAVLMAVVVAVFERHER